MKSIGENLVGGASIGKSLARDEVAGAGDEVAGGWRGWGGEGFCGRHEE